jgi:PAS domain S-box-containing protein
MTSLADFAAAALLLKGRQTRELLALNAAKTAEIVERKQAEELLRALIENLPGGAVFVVDRDLCYLLAEGEALSAAGFKPEDLVGQTIFEVLPPELAATYEVFYRKALAGESFEYEHNAHDRTYISQGTPLRSPNGEVYAVLALSYDISDRKLAEAQERESEEQYRFRLEQEVNERTAELEESKVLLQSVIDNVLVGIVVLKSVRDEKGEITDFEYQIVSAKAAQIMQQSDLVGKRIAEVFPECKSSGLFAEYVKVVETGKQWESVQNYPYDGSDQWIQTAASKLDDGFAMAFLDITELKQAEQEVIQVKEELAQRATDKYLTLFNSIDEGYFLCDVIFDENDSPIDIFYLDANRAATRMVGQDFTGRRLSEINPNYEAYWYEIFGRVARTGEGERLERYAEPDDKWYDFYVVKVSDDNSHQVAVIFQDISERKQNEESLRESEARIAADLAGMRRLYELQSKLADQNDVEAALQDVLAVACEFTGTDRGCVQLLSDDGERLYMSVWQGYADDSPFISFFRYEGLEMGCEVARVQRQRMIIEDTVGFPSLEGTDAGAAVHADGIRASQSTPMASRSGETIGVISTQFRQPHRPSDHELRLVDMLAWTAGEFLERHRADAALRQSEEKFRGLFQTMREGFMVSEIIRDKEGAAIDYRFLMLNPAYEKLAGLSAESSIGHTAKEIYPDLMDWGVDIYAGVVDSGEPLRFENYSEGLGKWFSVLAYPLGGDRFGILYDDITERKRREANQAFLAEIADDMSRLSTVDEIMETVGAKIGAYLEVKSCLFVDVDDAHGEVTVFEAWNTADVPSLRHQTIRLADFINEEFSRANRSGEGVVVRDTRTDPRVEGQDPSVLGVGTFVTVPFHRNGVWTNYLAVTDSQSRDWRDDEIELFRELSNRIFPRLERARAEDALRESEKQQAFLLKLSDALRPLDNPVEIQSVAMRVLGEHLQVDRVLYAEIVDDGETILIADNYVRGDNPKIVGQFPASDFGMASEILRAGQTFATSDINRDESLPEAEREALRALGNISCVAVPLVKKGRWVSNLGVYHGEPRQWTADEIRLLQETAERTWAAVERTRAEESLRESEIQRIQEQAAREEERQRAETLAELDRAKTIFFSNVSHEFRTPLTLLLAPLQDALSDRVNPLSPPQRERLELAHRNSLRLLKLVNTLLDFSRIEAGRMEAVYEATDLALLTTELASIFRSAIEQAGLRLIVDCPPLPEPVYVDREMWEKIVLNLLSNAFKFALEGEIAVRLHRADGDRVMLQIGDTGSGIPPEELPHLFERFYQVRGAASRTHEGSGIGLALVHELIRLHGGTVDVSSTVGQGSCFTVTIPLGTAHLPSDRIQAPRTLASTAVGAAPYVEQAQRWLPEESRGSWGSGGSWGSEEPLNSNSLSPPASPASPASPAPPARILLVDDNADMRDYLTRILSEYVQVEAVADGAAALAAAGERVPDLVLSDVMMPGLNGFELLKALRADARTREVPIILLSARAGVESVVEGLEAGADDYLIKPFSAQELVSRVNAHLQIAQLRGEALREERTSSRRKDELLSIVSHELNTPLVAILGWTRLLRTSPPSQSMLMKSLDTIERNAMLQAKLVQDLLDISRITADKLHLSLQPVELKSVIEMAIAAVLTAAIAKDIRLEWKHSWVQEASQISILGDSERLQQIVCNLLTNAIKFTPESGSVTVELSVSEAESASEKSSAQICITDTGIGIAADFLPHVFDRFRQAEGSAKGLGLGLAIGRHLVELHNGTIYAESSGVGQGATFTVKLPTLQES